MDSKVRGHEFGQIGAYIIMLAFSIFLYADMNIYHYPDSIVYTRLLVIIMYAIYLIMSYIPKLKGSRTLTIVYIINLMVVFIFIDYVLIVNTNIGESALNRAVQVSMAVNLGLVLFSETIRKYIGAIVLGNMVIAFGLQVILEGDVIELFFTYFNLIAFNVGLFIFNNKYYNLTQMEGHLTEKLNTKIEELEAEVAIQEMLEKALTQKANHDGMTKFLNRSEGVRVLSELFVESKKNNYPLSVCYMDLNDLKVINDTWGHDVGDQYILSFVDIIKLTLRNDDICVRMGGDEFLIILNNVSYSGAEVIWEKIQENIHHYQKIHNLMYQISVSHGICEREICHAASSHQMIDLADERMFEEKKRFKLMSV